MKKLSICLLVLFSLSSPLAFGDQGHDHSPAPSEPISKSEAGKKATQVVRSIAKKGKLPESWSSLEPATIKQKTFKKGPEWVVSFKNPKVENKERQTLYVFLTLAGSYLGANFSGN
jgi:hypothetical protein